jgi:hypothetical protein
MHLNFYTANEEDACAAVLLMSLSEMFLAKAFAKELK